MNNSKTATKSLLSSHGRFIPMNFTEISDDEDLKPYVATTADLLNIANEMINSRGAVSNNNNIPSAYTYLGQFAAHDISFDADSQIGIRKRPHALNLDSIYGEIPSENSKYTEDGLFRIGSSINKCELDLYRGEKLEEAITPDTRNDMHVVISQLTLSFLLFHNKCFNSIRKKSIKKRFFDARKQTILHFQWIFIRDFLKRLCNEEVYTRIWESEAHDAEVCRILNSSLTRFQSVLHIPSAFALAGYRIGHSMVRPEYGLNNARKKPMPIFDVGKVAKNGNVEKLPESRHLTGFRQLRLEWTVQWDMFVDADDGQTNPQASQSLDVDLAKALKFLPDRLSKKTSECLADTESKLLKNLAFRTLKTGVCEGLPSGQGVAKFLGLRGHDVIRAPKSRKEDPLWYYVLKEADQQAGGERLGKVGSWIVAGTIFNLLDQTSPSILDDDSSWNPMDGPDFSLRDFLTYSGLPITKDEWVKYVDK